MAAIGFHASHEQASPSELLHAVRAAEAAGFACAMCSDHFSPWSERQGESGFAWSWLGAALQATSLPFGVVNAPGQRYHPAVIAQAAATLCELFPGRFWLALGTGEFSNEHITGEPWPDKRTRNARLAECVAVMRALLRRGGRRPRRAGARRPRPALDPAAGPAAADRRGGERGDRGVGGELGGRADHDPAAAGAARARVGGVPRQRWRGQDHRRAGASLVGARGRRRAAYRPRPVAHERLQPAAVLGPRDRRAVRRGRASRAPGGRPRGGAGLVRSRAPRCLVARAVRAGMGRDLPAPRGARAARRSSRPSASTSCPQLADG